MEGRKCRRHRRGKKTEEDKRKGLISNFEEEDGKGHADIFRLPTKKQFQVTADTGSHFNVSTTMIYTHLVDDDVAHAMRTFRLETPMHVSVRDIV